MIHTETEPQGYLIPLISSVAYSANRRLRPGPPLGNSIHPNGYECQYQIQPGPKYTCSSSIAFDLYANSSYPVSG